MCTEVQNLSKCTLLLPTSVVYMKIRIDQGDFSFSLYQAHTRRQTAQNIVPLHLYSSAVAEPVYMKCCGSRSSC